MNDQQRDTALRIRLAQGNGRLAVRALRHLADEFRKQARHRGLGGPANADYRKSLRAQADRADFLAEGLRDQCDGKVHTPAAIYAEKGA